MYALAALAAAAGAIPPIPVLLAGAAAAVALAAEALLRSGRVETTRGAASRARLAILDTSVLIDGRIEGLVASGFVPYDLAVPEFVLRELQHVADSSEGGRRTRGRRGLDVLKALTAATATRTTVIPDDVPEEDEVDLKLVALARRRGAALVTTDFNLNKVATIRGVVVLNLNELAHALRPVVLPGETLTVTIVKEGKEPGQGVGYLDDGTMVVVDQGRPALGRTLAVVVTSGLQTAAGKMFFARRTDV